MKKPSERKVTFKQVGSVWAASCTGSPEVKIYESLSRGKPLFTVVYYLAGVRKRDVKTTLEAAKAHAEIMARTLAAGDAAVAPISVQERVEFARARAALTGLNLTVDLAAGRLADALKRLEGASLEKAVEFFVEHHPRRATTKTVSEAVAEFLAARKADGCGKRHLDDLKFRLEKFAAAFNCPLTSVTTQLIVDWLRTFNCGGRTRNNYRTALRNFFRDAAGRGLISDRQISWDPDHGVTLAQEEDGVIGIFTPTELQKLLAAAKPTFDELPVGFNLRWVRAQGLLPFLVLGAFAGLRSSEICSQRWEDINLERGYIRVTKAKGNTPQKRLVPISDNLKAWLMQCKRETGVCCEHARPEDPLRRLAKRAGVEWKHNALRHSYISYRVAQTQDVAKVSLEAGNSTKMINAHYRELVTPEEAATWFAIRP
ncbi:MAG: tyrosine-type recombinase/integrase [Verrucomicrobiia bacterium]